MSKQRVACDAASAQRRRFVEAARALGADEDKAAFRDKLAVIAQQRPKVETPAPSKAERKTKGA